MRLSHTLGTVCAALLISHAGYAQPQEPIGATMRFQVAHTCGAWSDFVSATPGDRIEWRIVMTFTGTQAAAALGRIRYQPLIVNADVVGIGAQRDALGTFRNNGISGQTTSLSAGLLSAADGANSCPLANGYGRVQYGASPHTAAGTGGLTGFLHVPNDSAGAPPFAAGYRPDAGNGYFRISGANSPQWYTSPGSICPAPCPPVYSVVSDNNTAVSTWFATGTQSVVIFRQSLTLSDLNDSRGLALTAESVTLLQSSGTYFMTWAAAGEGGNTATIRNGVRYEPAIISIAFGLPNRACNDIDFNNDGSTFDPQDIDAFLSVYSEGPCIPETATCDILDFNNDGSIFDPCDIDSFLLQYAEGPCTPCGT